MTQKIPRHNAFVKDYSLPLAATAIFLLLVLGATLLRVSQRASLAGLLSDVTRQGKEYGTLLGRDKPETVTKNTDNPELPADVTPAGSTSSFGVTNTGSQSSGSGGGGSPAPVFSVAIASFQQDGVTLECTTPKPKLQTCSKRYVFSAGVRTLNGPGGVSYSWRSNLSSALEDGSFSAGGGEVLTIRQKAISLACDTPSSFSLQFVVLSPSFTQSATLNTNHNCNGI